MAKGLEVVQAVLEGQEVRHGDRWYQWDPAVGKFRMLDRQLGDAEHWCPSSRQLLTDEWEIRGPGMTFAEADAVMVAGSIVELPQARGRGIQYRIRKGSYEMREREGDGSLSAWEESMMGLDCIHATDWRVVEDPAEEKHAPDGRLTVKEGTHILKKNFLWEGASLTDAYGPNSPIRPLLRMLADEENAHFLADLTITELYRRAPAMFREDDASC